MPKILCHVCKKLKETEKREVKLPFYEDTIELFMEVCVDCDTAIAMPHSEVEKIKRAMTERRLV